MLASRRSVVPTRRPIWDDPWADMLSPYIVNHESIKLSHRGVEGVPTFFSLCRYGSSFVISVGVSNEVTASWVSDGRVGIKPNSKLPSHARYGV